MSRPTIDAAAGVNPLPTGRGVTHPYCPHDEGEPCDCHTRLHIATPRAARKPPPATTELQATVWQLTQQGRTARQIAEQLGITQRNVERLRQRARLHQEAG